MSTHIDNVKVSSDEMKERLLRAVTGPNVGQPYPDLLELYARTSGSKYVIEVFDSLKEAKS